MHIRAIVRLLGARGPTSGLEHVSGLRPRWSEQPPCGHAQHRCEWEGRARGSDYGRVIDPWGGDGGHSGAQPESCLWTPRGGHDESLRCPGSFPWQSAPPWLCWKHRPLEAARLRMVLLFFIFEKVYNANLTVHRREGSVRNPHVLPSRLPRLVSQFLSSASYPTNVFPAPSPLSSSSFF